jgi:hypothetical protein
MNVGIKIENADYDNYIEKFLNYFRGAGVFFHSLRHAFG